MLHVTSTETTQADKITLSVEAPLDRLRNRITGGRPWIRTHELARIAVQMLSGTLFRLRLKRGPVFLAYHPDSHAVFRQHPEFSGLFQSFTAANALNNGGDMMRLWSFTLNLKQVLSENVPGDFAELGVWRGNTASVLAHYAATNGRKMFLFDTFTGFDAADLKGIDASKTKRFANTSLEMVKETLGQNVNVCEFVQGYFPEAVTQQAREASYAVVSLDCDLYEPTKAGLAFFYERMPTGGLFLLHDYSSMFWNGPRAAIDEFCAQSGERLILMPDKSGSAFFRKSK